MQPSSSLRGTFAPDDVNPMHPHTPPPHRGPRRLARVDRFRAGYQFGKGILAPSRLPRISRSNIWIRAVANRVNRSKERVRLSLIFRGT
jgi:hypothetical protein